VWLGDTWAFRTAGYIVVDDFESYGNISPNRPFQTWIDGVGFTEPAPGNTGNNTGAAAGHDIWEAGGTITRVLSWKPALSNSGQQSLPLYYDKLRRRWTPEVLPDGPDLRCAADWTQSGITNWSSTSMLTRQSRPAL